MGGDGRHGRDRELGGAAVAILMLGACRLFSFLDGVIVAADAVPIAVAGGAIATEAAAAGGADVVGAGSLVANVGQGSKPGGQLAKSLVTFESLLGSSVIESACCNLFRSQSGRSEMSWIFGAKFREKSSSESKSGRMEPME
jgi:hypothetical protein